MKSDYSKESITEFLSRKYGEDIRLFPIKEGQESQAYWFSRGGREYVVRINSNMEGFKKDKYAYEHFRSDRVPIPEVVETGNFDGTHYFCISVKADGITYEDSDEETVVRLLGDITDGAAYLRHDQRRGPAFVFQGRGYGILSGRSVHWP